MLILSHYAEYECRSGKEYKRVRRQPDTALYQARARVRHLKPRPFYPLQRQAEVKIGPQKLHNKKHRETQGNRAPEEAGKAS